MKPNQWLKVISVKYKSTKGITKEKFDELIEKISIDINQKIIDHDGDFIFEIKLDNVNCMGGIVPITKDPITECQFTVMTQEDKKPEDLMGIEPVHILMEQLFLK